MKIGVIGLAGVGRTHVDRWATIPDADLVSVCDIVPQIADDFASKYNVKGYTSTEEMLAKEDLTAISICTPPKVHLTLTRMAAERGIHVLCEKPMASTVADCQAMISVCKANGVVLQIGHKKRFIPPLLRLKELAASEFGPIQYMVHRYPHPGMSNKDWFWAEDDGGGPILENAVHAADILGFLMGDVERVYAEAGTFFAPHRKPQIDSAVFTLRFKSGAIAVVNAGMVSMEAFNFEDFYVANENGVAEVTGGFDRAETLRYAFRTAPSDVQQEEYPNFDAFRAEIEHFIECIRTGNEPRASGEAGMKAVEICRAVKKSAEIGAPVEL
ncbi:MAG: Gfo/Idh/MocA family oxidoreductase [Candidatus Poribacteria bacterium]|nr:Gfo/Idh/MocA family oxidoreductase [Candidatus Poribacteria bacterium]